MRDAAGLAATPPMGWNSWNAYSCAVTEEDVREAAGAHGPGGWNDPDMLQIGNGPDSGQSQHEPTSVHRPLSDAESRTHFGFWCLLAAPLMVSTDTTSRELRTHVEPRDTAIFRVTPA